jgi:hypothetical protein
VAAHGWNRFTEVAVHSKCNRSMTGYLSTSRFWNIAGFSGRGRISFGTQSTETEMECIKTREWFFVWSSDCRYTAIKKSDQNGRLGRSIAKFSEFRRRD